MSEDYKLISAKINFFRSCFLAHSFDAFGIWSCHYREDIAWRLSSVVMNSLNAIITEFDYFRLGLAQLGRIGVIAWRVEIIRLDVARERSGNDRKH